jgi:hypothetical protein
MFVCGGCPACAAGGCGMPATWTFNFSNTSWQNMSPSGTGPVTCCGDVAAYDSATNKVYFMDIRAACGGYSTAGLFAYSYSNNSWTHINSDVLDNLTYAVAIDAKRHTFLVVGGGKVYAYSLDNPAAGAQTWATTGDTGFIGQTSMGLAYDPVSDNYVGWKGGAVYVLDPVTKVWTSHNPAGGPPSNVAGVMNGIYTRWQYVPSVNAFTTVVDVDGNVYFYKLTAGPGTGVSAAKAMSSSAPHILVQSNSFQGGTSLMLEGIPSQHIRACGIYNMRGELVCNLTAELKAAEGRQASWDTGLQSPGVYLFRVDIRDGTFEKSFILIK